MENISLYVLTSLSLILLFPCSGLLKKLLEKRPGDRITIQEIKQHAFFRDIDWDALLRKELDPPCLLLKADDLEVKGETY